MLLIIIITIIIIIIIMVVVVVVVVVDDLSISRVHLVTHPSHTHCFWDIHCLVGRHIVILRLAFQVQVWPLGLRTLWVRLM